MTEERRDKYHGQTESEYLYYMAHELDRDDIGVGLNAPIGAGRHRFDLEGADLIAFVRRAILALLEKGAVPRHWGTVDDPMRNVMLHYGSDTPDEIADGIIADWQAMGGGDLQWGDFWFARPGTLE